jgi:hypothetical protein
MNALLRAFRAVLPHPGIAAGVLVFYTFAQVAYAIWGDPRVRLTDFSPLAMGLQSFARSLHRGSCVLLFLCAVAYGVYRVVAFHPIFQPEYRAWLKTTPWTSRHPLPFGPVALRGYDVVFFVLLELLIRWRHPEVRFGNITLWFLFVYECLLAISLAIRTVKGPSFIAAFTLALFALLWSAGVFWGALTTAVVLYAILIRATGKSLAEIEDWELTEGIKQFVAQLMSRDHFRLSERGATHQSLGWPFEVLRPNREDPSVNRLDGLLLSALAGWWLYAFFKVPMNLAGGEIVPEPMRLFEALSFVSFQFAIVWRVWEYAWGYFPPIGLLGRVATGRLIIPKYDIIFVAPLAAYALWFLGLFFCRMAQLSSDISGPLLLTAASAVLLLSGPNLRQWRLTGAHRTNVLAARASNLRQSP